MIRGTGMQKHHKATGQIVHGKRELLESRRDLTNLIYWMEHDRSLDAQPDKIVLLRKLLVNLGPFIDKGLTIKVHTKAHC